MSSNVAASERNDIVIQQYTYQQLQVQCVPTCPQYCFYSHTLPELLIPLIQCWSLCPLPLDLSGLGIIRTKSISVMLYKTEINKGYGCYSVFQNPAITTSHHTGRKLDHTETMGSQAFQKSLLRSRHVSECTTCLSYSSTAVIRQHDQGNLQKSLFGAPSFRDRAHDHRGRERVTAGRHGDREVAQSLDLDP